MNFDKTYVLDLLKDILSTDSPSGFTIMLWIIENYALNLGYAFLKHKKVMVSLKF